ncbi:uncharacterized protein PSFLO_02444 [Pseudozyma flocculosa]|uniref:Uncharacterized protein n=1 Tax=Pseudozyma flocculosa TaxID=84751 RepID=A0A5C3EXZ3_9BASI|nr:uncharacterized protein PSFLO_02444 [Pseudozyma flocculosa]
METQRQGGGGQAESRGRQAGRQGRTGEDPVQSEHRQHRRRRQATDVRGVAPHRTRSQARWHAMALASGDRLTGPYDRPKPRAAMVTARATLLACHPPAEVWLEEDDDEGGGDGEHHRRPPGLSRFEGERRRYVLALPGIDRHLCLVSILALGLFSARWERASVRAAVPEQGAIHHRTSSSSEPG